MKKFGCLIRYDVFANRRRVGAVAARNEIEAREFAEKKYGLKYLKDVEVKIHKN